MAVRRPPAGCLLDPWVALAARRRPIWSALTGQRFLKRRLVAALQKLAPPLPHDPIRHRPLVRHDHGLEWLDPFAAQRCGRRQKHLLVHQEAGTAVGKTIAPAFQLFGFIFDSNGRSQAREEDSARLQHTPHLTHHFMPVVLVPGKVEHRAADDNVKVLIRKRHRFNQLYAKVSGGKVGRQQSCQGLDLGNRFRRFIDSANFETALQEVIEIAPAATPGVKHTHPGNEAALQQLIE